MSDQFLFVCTNIGNEKLLKEEIRVFYPELKLSYSRKGFLTFKNTGVHYDIKTISQLRLTFSTRLGICLGKSKQETLLKDLSKFDINLDDYTIHSFNINCDVDFDAETLLKSDVNQYSSHGKDVLNIIILGENELWFGVHSVSAGITRHPNSKVFIQEDLEAPSKAFTKLAQIDELYSIKMNSKQLWLDFGAAPGGASHYLLSKGCKVWGVDPAKMDEKILRHKNFKHISVPVQDLSQEKLPDEKIDWVHVDLNLNPKQGIKEVLRLIKKYNFTLKGIIFTIQVVKIEYVELIEDFEDQFDEWGFSDIISCQVPAHKNEYVIIANKR